MAINKVTLKEIAEKSHNFLLEKQQEKFTTWLFE